MILFWVEQGVRIFRVDNPHTKPMAFWEWLIAEVQRDPSRRDLPLRSVHPPQDDEGARQGRLHPVLHVLHLAQLQAGAERVFHRVDPDRDAPSTTAATSSPTRPIFCRSSCRKAADPRSRCASPSPRPCPRSTASTAASSYAKTPRCRARRSTSTPRNTSTRSGTGTDPATSSTTSRRINDMRRAHPALHEYDNLRFYHSDDDNVLCYGKATADGSDIVVGVVNLDPFAAHETWIHLPLDEFGIDPAISLSGRGAADRRDVAVDAHQPLRLDPHDEPARFFALRPIRRVSYVEGCG